MLTIYDKAIFIKISRNKSFLKTKFGNYIWSDPEYGGNNSIKKFKGSLQDAFATGLAKFSEHKGEYNINYYCGSDVDILE